MSTSFNEVSRRLAERLRAREGATEEESLVPAADPEEGESPPAPEMAESEPSESEAEDEAPSEPEEPVGAAPEPRSNREPEEGEYVRTITELAEHLEVEPSYLYGLTVPNDAGEQLTLGELKDLAVQSRRAKGESERIAEERKRLESEREGLQRQFAESVAVVNGILEAEEAILADEEKEVLRLRADDPTEYAIRKDDLRERREALKQRKGQVLAEYRKAVEAENAKQEQLRRQALQINQSLLVQKIPEWSDPKVRDAEGREVAAFLKAEGYSDEDVSSLIDARSVKIARLAMLQAKSLQKKDVAVKKVKALPKRVKSAGKADQQPTGVRQEQNLRRQLRKSGKFDDAVKLMKHRFEKRFT